MTAPDVSVIIVTHCHRAFVEPCLDSLMARRVEASFEVLLVDNQSGDGTPEVVRERYPEVRVEVRDRRRGFSDNNNFAIRRATGRYILVLNPDTQVRPGALRALVDFMDRTPEAGIAGAKLLYPDGAVQPSCRRFPTFASVVARRTPLRLFMSRSKANARHLMLDLPPSAPTEVDWLLGACLFVRRTAIDQVGLLDEGFFLYVEDIDWCYRMKRAGWKVCWVPQAEIFHRHLAESDRKLFSWHSWVHFRSMLRYYRKHLAPTFFRLRTEIPR